MIFWLKFHMQYTIIPHKMEQKYQQSILSQNQKLHCKAPDSNKTPQNENTKCHTLTKTTPLQSSQL